ncbi:uncharacterized protein LOC128552325 [Mercenaria mercenaria]|uniref:uncharacterized protein LOC128552325 n=1 Tax=Mercenaria mercenaria TaxID=6596 RepID=UPI00234F9527|nr:uncharacterized protein LOC128552325 [Mercenaria mercenaria]
MQCEDSGIRSTASYYCEECEEYLCEMCRESHSTRRATKSHIPVPISFLKPSDSDENKDREESSKMCDPCTYLDKRVVALSFCAQCEELLCADCTKLHRTRKLTKSHMLKKPKRAEIVKVKCGICESKTDKKTAMYCSTCEETLCGRCANKHKQKKMFQNHSLRATNDNIPKPTIKCDPCNKNNEVKSAETFCKQCEEHLCEFCTRHHSSQKMTKHHNLIDPISCAAIFLLCDTCLENEIQAKATSYCIECEENFCDDCGRKHKSLKISKNHEIVDVSNIIPRRSIKNCNQCQENGKSANAVRYCTDCKKYFCTDCCQIHKRYKVTKSHNLLEIEEAYKSSKQHSNSCSAHGTKAVEESLKRIALRNRDVKPGPQGEKDIPGKPKSLNVLPDTITLSWDPPSQLDEKDLYEISFKVQDHDHQWKILSDKFTTTTADAKNLKSNTAYIFRVRVVCENNEGPWSVESDVILTLESLASQIVKFAVKIKDGDPSPAIYALPMTEIQAARDEKAMLRKFEFGANNALGGEAKTIMLAGPVGTGKSTMVDGFVNYVLGVRWDDPFRFTVSNRTQQEADGQIKNDAFADWVTTYTINPQKGSRLQYQLNIIDTPGLGDLRGLERDQQIVNHISQLFSQNQPKGVALIDAVCLLAKAPDARLSATQSCIYQLIMSLFGKDIEKNICSLVTFGDGLVPPVLSALRQCGLSFRRYFAFNNSSLISNNVNTEYSSVAKCFWEMGFKSFINFFDHIEHVGKTSLQLTRDVLAERVRLESTTTKLQPEFEARLSKFNCLQKEKEFFNEQQDFEFEVETKMIIKKDLPKGQYANNCNVCALTCHKNCQDSKINTCSVMDFRGNCTVCPQKCHWKSHARTSVAFELETVKEKKRYADVANKYKNAPGYSLGKNDYEGKLKEEVGTLLDGTEEMMSVIKACNKRLQEISLIPNPLTRTKDIDSLIENENLTKTDGYQQRIYLLKKFRGRAQTYTEFEKLRQEVNKTLGKG